jgi:hypothetical protein
MSASINKYMEDLREFGKKNIKLYADFKKDMKNYYDSSEEEDDEEGESSGSDDSSSSSDSSDSDNDFEEEIISLYNSKQHHNEFITVLKMSMLENDITILELMLKIILNNKLKLSDQELKDLGTILAKLSIEPAYKQTVQTLKKFSNNYGLTFKRAR